MIEIVFYIIGSCVRI